MAADDDIEIVVGLQDELSGPAQRVSASVDDIGDSARGASVGVELLERELRKVERELARVSAEAAAARAEIARLGGESARARPEVKKLGDEVGGNLLTKLERLRGSGGGGGFDLGKIIGIYKIPAIITAVTAAASAISALGAAGVAGAAGLAPLTGVVAAFPGLLTTFAQGMNAGKLALGGFAGAVKVLNTPGATPRALAVALQHLGPAARAAAREVAAFEKGPLQRMRVSAQGAFFPGFLHGFEALQTLLPTVQRGMTATAGVLGRLAARAGEMASTPMFRRDVGAVMRANTGNIATMGDAGLRLFDALRQVTVAAIPFTSWLVQSVDGMAAWAQAAATSGRESGRLAAFLDRTKTVLSGLASFLVNVGAGMLSVGHAAQSLATYMGTGLLGAAKGFRAWTESAAGQQRITQFFADAQPVIQQFSFLLLDLMHAFGRLSTQSNIAPLIAQLRTQLLPALMDLATQTTTSFGPAMVSAATGFARFVNILSFSPLATILQTGADLLIAFSSAVGMLPGPLRTAAASIVAFLAVWRAINVGSKVAGLLPVFRGIQSAAPGVRSSLRDVGAGARLMVGPLDAGTTRLGQMRTVMGMGFRGAAGSMRGALSGLVGMLGGPWGIALTAATVGLGYFIRRHQQAAAWQRTLTDAVIADSGALGENTRQAAANELQQRGLLEAAREAGVSLSDVTQATLGNVAAQRRVGEQLNATKAAYFAAQDAGHGLTDSLTSQFAAGQKLQGGVAELIGQTPASVQAARDRAAALGQEASATRKTAAEMLNQKLQAMSLRDALDRLNGKQITMTESQIAMLDGLRNLGAQFAKNSTSLNINTAAGSRNVGALLEQIRKNQEYVAKVHESTGSTDKARGAYDRATDALRRQAEKAGFTHDQIERIIKQYDRWPKRWDSAMRIQGLQEAYDKAFRLYGIFGDISGMFGGTGLPGVSLPSGGGVFANTGGGLAGLGGGGRRTRWAGGDVAAGGQYVVNELGPEAFLGRSGVSLLTGQGPTPWTPTEPGVVLPADMVNAMTNGAPSQRALERALARRDDRLAARVVTPLRPAAAAGSESAAVYAPQITVTNAQADIDVEAAVYRGIRKWHRDHRERR